MARLVVSLLLALMSAAGAQTAPICANTDPTADRFPAAKACCKDANFTCSSAGQIATGLKGGKKNVVILVVDDQGYCTNGYMGGRCARVAPGRRCASPVCSTSTWVSCSDDGDCPPGETCDDTDPQSVCDNALSVPCSEPALDCPAPGPGEPNPTCITCMHGYYQTCAVDEDCDQPTEACVDGHCSPRAECLSETGMPERNDFVCARGLGSCEGWCSNNLTVPCSNPAADCPPVGCSSPPATCKSFCAGTSKQMECKADGDCNDYCEQVVDGGATQWLCKRTPEPCGPNSECSSDDMVCTTSDSPLRLNDISCRYRQDNASLENWLHSLSVAPNYEQTTYTPTLDRLAAESVVFPRARGGGQSCKPARGALFVGRSMRHMNATYNTSPPQQCRARSLDDPLLPQTFDEPARCTAAADCQTYAGVCDAQHSLPWWLSVPKNPGMADADPLMRDAHTIAIAKVEINSIKSQFDDNTAAGGQSDGIGKFAPCDLGSACGEVFASGRIPKRALDGQAPIVSRVRGTINPNGQDAALPPGPHLPFFLWHGPEMPHDASENGSNTEPFFNGLYGDPNSVNLSASQMQQSATSYFDASLSALFDELQRTCVCGPDPAAPDPDSTPVKASIMDYTVVVALADHGKLLPSNVPNGSAKNGPATENAQRLSLVLHVPGEPPRVLSESSQFAAFYDLMPTLIDYVNGFDNDTGIQDGKGDELDRYPINLSLRHFIGDETATPYLRDIFYGGDGIGFSAIGNNDRRYLVTRAGFLGVCSNPAVSRVCMDDEDCSDVSGGTCVRNLGHCINTRSVCANDEACAGDPQDPMDVCQPHASCTTASGNCCIGSGFHDFGAGTDCVTDADCVPRGTCRLPIVKVAKEGPAGNMSVFDLNSNPDEFIQPTGEPNEEDLADTDYMDEDLQAQFEACLDEFWTLQLSTDPVDHDVWRPDHDGGCPDNWRQWPVCTEDPLSCPAFP